MIHVEKFAYLDVDDLCANTYVVFDANKKCVVIDPSKDNDGIIKYIQKNNLILKAVLLTHGHFDHIRGVDRLCNCFKDVPLYIHDLDKIMLLDSYFNGSEMLGEEFIVKHKPILLSGDETLSILEDNIKVIHTPFHTKGSVCYYFTNNKLLFSGDTLFKNSIGRDDLPNADSSKTNQSLKKIKALPKETKIYPGHGSNTVLDDELRYNYFLTR